MTIFFVIVIYNRNNAHLERNIVRRQYGTLYQGIVLERSPTSKYYHLILFFRVVLLTILIALAEKIPMIQIIPMINYNLWFVYYLFTSASFEDKILNGINIFKETMILLGEICIFCICFEVKSLRYYNILGWIIVGSLGSAMGIELLYVIGMQFYKIGAIVRIIINLVKSVKFWICNQFKQRRKRTAKTLNKRLPRLTYVA